MNITSEQKNRLFDLEGQKASFEIPVGWNPQKDLDYCCRRWKINDQQQYTGLLIAGLKQRYEWFVEEFSEMVLLFQEEIFFGALGTEKNHWDFEGAAERLELLAHATCLDWNCKEGIFTVLERLRSVVDLYNSVRLRWEKRQHVWGYEIFQVSDLLIESYLSVETLMKSLTDLMDYDAAEGL